MTNPDDDWVFVCDDCGEEWSLTHRTKVHEHEKTHGHSVYQRYKASHERSKVEGRVRGKS